MFLEENRELSEFCQQLVSYETQCEAETTHGVCTEGNFRDVLYESVNESFERIILLN